MKTALGISIILSFFASFTYANGASMKYPTVPATQAVVQPAGLYLASDGAENLDRWHRNHRRV